MRSLWNSPEFIRSLLDLNDERKAQEQFNEKYAGGWNPVKEFVVDWHDIEFNGMDVSFPILYYGMDVWFPVLDYSKREHLDYSKRKHLLALTGFDFRDQQIYIFPYAWVLIIDNPYDIENEQSELARMD